ncbi:MAG: hypothetical protein ABIH92_04275 [Nanoarchaeota archaeon]
MTTIRIDRGDELMRGSLMRLFRSSRAAYRNGDPVESSRIDAQACDLHDHYLHLLRGRLPSSAALALIDDIYFAATSN